MNPRTRSLRRALVGLTASLFVLLGTAGLSAQAYQPAGLNITPGSDGSSLDFAWLSNGPIGKPVVQIAMASDQKGDAFPAAKATAFTGTASKVAATAFSTDDQTVTLDSVSNKVTVTGLVDSTDYVYRVGDGKQWSTSSSVSTRDPKSFGFFAVGDPQLGAKSTGPKTLDSDAAGWRTTIEKATTAFSGASFLVSLGDQVNDYNALAAQDAEYAAYFAPAQLRSLPVATVDGNHDFAMGEYYGYHYNLPNLSTRYGISYGNDGDYWFVYGNVLFLMLNSNSESVATHDLFIRDAVARNPGARWRVACFHHSVFSEADHYADPDIIDRRTNYPPVFERYKIDVVLQGHDHAYTRSLPIAKGKPVEGADPAATTIVNPTGIVYFTLNSGSGSKFYDWKDAVPEVFSAARWQGKVPSFSYISVNGNTFSVATFRTDDMSVIDTFTITKD